MIWWLDPPHDAHRQEGLRQGALELVIVAQPPDGDGRVFAESDGLGTVGPLADAVARQPRETVRAMRDLYHDDVVADVCVPSWRFQLRGPDAIEELLDAEEFGLDDQRLHSYRQGLKGV